MSRTVPVTPDNFNRAESDLVFSTAVREGALGAFVHHRVPAGPGFAVVRPNRDTLYSIAVFDLDAGPVTITLPDPGRRFLSMQIVDEEQYTLSAYYCAGRYTLDRQHFDTRYVLSIVRIFVNPTQATDVQQVHALQDAIRVYQPSRGCFEIPEWDQESQSEVREALLRLGARVPDTRRMFGPKHEVDPVRHLIGTATGYGGNPLHDAFYVSVRPAKNDGITVHRLTVKDVPVDGFWSVTVYDAEGHFAKNALDAYSLNNVTAEKAPDGSVTIQFGGCAGQRNCLPIMTGWNYLVRLYRPRKEILDGTWKFPEAQPIG